MASAADVNAFLLKFKAKVNAQEMIFLPREENMSALATLRMSFDHADAVILGLTSENYCKGPEEDHDGSPGEVWFFGETIERTVVYIKLKLDGERAVCMSFHPARFSLQFPLRTP